MLIPPVHTALPSNTTPTPVPPWAITTSGAPFHGLRAAAQQLALQCGLLPVRSPLLRKSTFVSSPAPIDMLKSRAFLVASHAFRPHACRVPLVSDTPFLTDGAYTSRTRAQLSGMIIRLVLRPKPCYDLHLIYFSLFRTGALHPKKHLRY
jgi:hypothetical protein